MSEQIWRSKLTAVSRRTVTIQCQDPAANNNYWFFGNFRHPEPAIKSPRTPSAPKTSRQRTSAQFKSPLPTTPSVPSLNSSISHGYGKKPFSISNFTRVEQFGSVLRSKHFLNLFLSQVWHEKRTHSCTLTPRYSWCSVSAGRDFRHSVSPHGNGFFWNRIPVFIHTNRPEVFIQWKKMLSNIL